MTKKLALVSALLLTVAVSGFVHFRNGPNIKADSNSLTRLSNATEQPTHPLRFYDPKSFSDGVSQAQTETKKTDYHIVGGIIPHHLLPGFIIADFFNRLSVQKPSTIILIGPNHYEQGHYKALTSRYSWQTPFGTVTPNQTIIDDLVKHNLVQIDEVAVPNDHSTSGSIPFVKFYMPDARVVPIILSAKMAEADIKLLSDRLKTYLDKDTVLVAPVDFSHYLSAHQAQENDKLTFQIMRDFDYKRLLSLNNDYVDSPVSVATLLMTMQKMGATKQDLLYNTNSGILAKDDHIETTSYFSILFH